MKSYSTAQITWLLIVRYLIGWHFLYEGLVKLVNQQWSAAPFLLDSGGFMVGFFIFLANHPSLLKLIDFINIWGLILVGLSLITGVLCRMGLISGIVMLSLFYLSHPPFPGLKYAMPQEGSYLIVNKNLIELAVLGLLYVFPAGPAYSLSRTVQKILQAIERKKS